MNSKEEEEDEVALIDMFMELARRDEVKTKISNAYTQYLN